MPHAASRTRVVVKIRFQAYQLWVLRLPNEVATALQLLPKLLQRHHFLNRHLHNLFLTKHILHLIDAARTVVVHHMEKRLHREIAPLIVPLLRTAVIPLAIRVNIVLRQIARSVLLLALKVAQVALPLHRHLPNLNAGLMNLVEFRQKHFHRQIVLDETHHLGHFLHRLLLLLQIVSSTKTLLSHPEHKVPLLKLRHTLARCEEIARVLLCPISPKRQLTHAHRHPLPNSLQTILHHISNPRAPVLATLRHILVRNKTNILRHLLQQAQLLSRPHTAQRRHSIKDPHTLHLQRIRRTFHSIHHLLLPRRLPRHIQTIQLLPLPIHQRLRRIHILRRILIIPQRPASEASHIPQPITNRQHQAIPKSIIIVPRFLAHTNQTQLLQKAKVLTTLPRPTHQRIPSIRSHTHKRISHSLRTPASHRQAPRTRLTLQQRNIKVRHPPVQRPQRLPLPALLLRLRLLHLLLKHHTSSLSQPPASLRKTQALLLHHKRNRITALLARTKAMPRLPNLRNMKARRPLIMKRTATHPVTASPLQLQPITLNQTNNVSPL